MATTPDWLQTLQQTNELTPAIIDTILEQHGDRGIKAITAVCENRVKQYNDFLVVVGHHQEYILEDHHCHCNDTKYNLDTPNSSEKCWHSLAALIASELNTLDTHDIWYTDVWDGIN